MDKTKNQLEKIFEHIIYNNHTAALKLIKKLKESISKNASLEQKLALSLFSSYAFLKTLRLGMARYEIQEFADLSKQANPSFLLENAKMICTIIQTIGNLNLLPEIFEGTEKENKTINNDFLKIMIETRLLKKDSLILSNLFMKKSKIAKKSGQFLLASFIFKIFAIFQNYSEFEIGTFSDYFLFDFNLTLEDINKLDFLLKLSLQTVMKNPELNNKVVHKYLCYLEILGYFYAQNFQDKFFYLLNKLDCDYEYFIIIKKILKKTKNVDLKKKIKDIYLQKFLEYIRITDLKELETKQPNFEEIKYIVNLKIGENNDAEIDISEEFIQNILKILNKNVEIILNEQKFSFHLKNAILGIILFSSDENKLDLALKTYINKFSDQQNFGNETLYIFEIGKENIHKNEKILLKIYEILKSNSKLSEIQRINLKKIGMILNKSNQILENSSWVDFLREYCHCFDSKFSPSKGERRQEDDWLVLALNDLKFRFLNSKDSNYLLMLNYLSLLGYTHSKYNFDILLILVYSNSALGIYRQNCDLFLENDIKGNQNETLAFTFFSSYFENIIYDKNSPEVLMRYFKNADEVARKSAKIWIHTIKSSNYNFSEEIWWNFDMNQQSYFRAIIFLYLENKSIMQILKNEKEEKDDFRFFQQKLNKTEAFSFYNLDFLTDSSFGVFSNPEYLQICHLLNNLIFEILENGFSEKSNKVAKIIQTKIENLHNFNPEKFFKAVRKNLNISNIENNLLKAKESWLVFSKTDQFIFLTNFILIITEILTEVHNANQLDSTFKRLEQSLLILPSFLNLKTRENIFLVGNLVNLIHRVVFLMKNVPKCFSKYHKFKLILGTFNSEICENIYLNQDSSFYDLLEIDLSIMEFVKEKLCTLKYKTHLEDSFAYFKFMIDQEYKSIKAN